MGIIGSQCGPYLAVGGNIKSAIKRPPDHRWATSKGSPLGSSSFGPATSGDKRSAGEFLDPAGPQPRLAEAFEVFDPNTLPE
jgi:hypothetical protein